MRHPARKRSLQTGSVGWLIITKSVGSSVSRYFCAEESLNAAHGVTDEPCVGGKNETPVTML